MGLSIPLGRALGMTGGFLWVGWQQMKQLWRPATLWELGDVAGPLSQAPHSMHGLVLGASARWVLEDAPEDRDGRCFTLA